MELQDVELWRSPSTIPNPNSKDMILFYNAELIFKKLRIWLSFCAFMLLFLLMFAASLIFNRFKTTYSEQSLQHSSVVAGCCLSTPWFVLASFPLCSHSGFCVINVMCGDDCCVAYVSFYANLSTCSVAIRYVYGFKLRSKSLLIHSLWQTCYIAHTHSQKSSFIYREQLIDIYDNCESLPFGFITNRCRTKIIPAPLKCNTLHCGMVESS